MAAEQTPPEDSATTFDEPSIQRTKPFLKALQELKDLTPQIYSAAEYSEKCYVHTEHKEMVLNNLKDYAVRALVNAVDHLGNVAYKLTDLLEQQSLEFSNMDVKVTCLNQQLLTCKTFMEKEGLRQRQLLAISPRHHKHYSLPTSGKKVKFSRYVVTDPSQQFSESRILPSGTPAPNTLSWHLASETKSTLKDSALALLRPGDQRVSERTKVKSNPTTLDPGHVWRSKNSATHPKLPRVGPATRAAIQTLGVLKQGEDQAGELPMLMSFRNPPARSKSMFSLFFGKKKTLKLSSSYFHR